MYDPQIIYDYLMEAGNDWADKKAAFVLLDDNTKSVLADVKNDSPGKSDAERTSEALADRRYRLHLNEKNQAFAAFLLAQVKYDSAKALADARRTQASTRRAEAQYTGMQNG